jgi:hypothetical protein
MTVTDKSQMISLLMEEFNRWNDILSTLTDEQADSVLYDNRTIKDDIAHLWIWQCVSVARMEAAINGHEPRLDWWHKDYAPEDHDHTDEINDWIYQSNRDTAWAEVYKNWREQFRHFIGLGEQVSESDLLDTSKYSWLNGYPLMAVLNGSYEHHHIDHFPHLLAWVNKS